MMVAGVRIDPMDAHQASSEIIKRAGQPAAVHLCNAYTLSLTSKDKDLEDALNRGDLNLPDGMPLVWIARRLGISIADRAYGPDVMLETLDQGRHHGLRHYLYGSTPEVIQKLKSHLFNEYPGIDIVGAEPHPHRTLSDKEESDLVRRIIQAEASVVWVGLGTPLQDIFVDQFRERISTPLVAVGAAFDFHAGLKKQAPPLLQQAGLEWAFRLATEPRRLAKRYLVGNAIFLRAALSPRPHIVD